MGQALVRFDKLRSSTVMSGSVAAGVTRGRDHPKTTRSGPAPPDRLVGGRTHEELRSPCVPKSPWPPRQGGLASHLTQAHRMKCENVVLPQGCLHSKNE